MPCLILLFLIASPAGPATPAADDRVQIEISPRPLPDGLRIGMAPRALVLFVRNREVDRVKLPQIPRKAKRLADHAILAMGTHGLWILRVGADDHWVIVQKMKLPESVDGFEILNDRVMPTTRPIQAYFYRSNLVPKPVVPPPGKLDHLLPGIRARSKDWPEPLELPEPGFPMPGFYVETNFLYTQATQLYARQEGRMNDPLHWGIELSLRLGFHVYREHVAGISLLRLIGWQEPTFDNNRDYDEQVWSMYNPTGLFYQYAPSALPVGVQVEPIRVEYREGTPAEYGGRLTLQLVKRTAPMRLGFEMRTDVTRTIIRVSFAIVCGFNF
ncbi:hypothetical protein KJ975_08025 [Myxococcota bacterium]|nr:hypothetical protein [Myxococcota bacterium]